MRPRLAIVVSHPIQYHSPLFALIAQRGKVEIMAFYTWGEDVLKDKFDPGFGKIVNWDIPLLEGYNYQFEKNIATDKGSHHNKGIINPELIANIKNWNADAILVFGWNFDSHLKAIKYFNGKIPVYFRGDSTLLDEQPGFSIKKIVRAIVLRWVYKSIDKAFYVGTNNKNYFKKFGLKNSQLVYAPHAIDNARFNSNAANYEQEAAQWRAELNIKSDDLVFLFAGKLERKKDPLLLINAFLASSMANAHLVIVGNGELEEDIKSIVKDKANIHLAGFQNQSKMPIVYRLCNVYILPSQGPNETWGLAINEAMASGRAVIASNRCGGAIDLIAEGENGYVFEAGNEAALKEALQKIYARRHEIKEMGNRSAEIIKQFSYANIAAAIEDELTAL